MSIRLTVCPKVITASLNPAVAAPGPILESRPSAVMPCRDTDFRCCLRGGQARYDDTPLSSPTDCFRAEGTPPFAVRALAA